MLRVFAVGLACLGLLGCSPDNRIARDAAATVLATTIRDYGVRRADALATACVDVEWALPLIGAQDVALAQKAWIRARLEYDHAAALFKLAAPEIDALIDGELDSPLTRSGLRRLEQPLFGKPTADALTLNWGARALAEASVRLPAAMADSGRTLDVGVFLSTMSGLAVVAGAKLDGSDSPFAQQSIPSVRSGIEGIAAMYEPLSGLTHATDGALDDQIHQLLSDLLSQLQGVSATEQVRDKALFLRRTAELGQVLLKVGPALGQSVSAIVDVT